jgi:hypothetical protein
MSQSEFGRRTEGITREGLRNIQGVHFERTPGDDPHEEGASRLRRMAFWIGAGALLIGIYVGTKGSGRELHQYWNRNSAPVVAQAYVPIPVRDVMLERVSNTCVARGDNAGQGDVVRQAAVYVVCLSAESPRRLCRVTHRTHFLSAVTNYYRLPSTDPDVRPDAQVADALKTVVLAGVIPRRDIVAAGNPDLEVLLRGVEPAKSGC